MRILDIIDVLMDIYLFIVAKECKSNELTVAT